MKRLRVMLAALVLLIGAGIVLWRGELFPDPAGAIREAKRNAPHSSENVLAIVPGAARPPSLATPVKSRVTPLMQEFIDSRNDKLIYDRLKAKTNPTGEELWVVARILERCGKITDSKFPNQHRWGETLGTPLARERFAASLSPRAPDREKRVAAFDAMNFDPCKEMGELKLTEKELRAAYERAAEAGDPKGRINLLEYQLKDQIRDEKGDMDWSKPRIISDAQLETWKQAVASGDPRAVMDAVSVILSSNLGNVHLRGPDEAPIDGTSLYYAAMLASCELGRDCSRNSQYLQQSCALEGACDAADMRDYLLFYNSPPSRSQLVVQYQQQLMRVIRDGDWSFFTFAPGPAPGQAPFQRP